MVALRRPPPVCVGSPFGSLHPVILLSLGYMNLAAPTGRRPPTITALCAQGQSPRSLPHGCGGINGYVPPASWFTSVPLADDRPPSVRGRVVLNSSQTGDAGRGSAGRLFLTEREHRRGRSAKYPPICSAAWLPGSGLDAAPNRVICIQLHARRTSGSADERVLGRRDSHTNSACRPRR